MIGKLDRRITIRRCGSTQTETGGLNRTILLEWSIWAKVEDRSGSQLLSESKEEYSYDYKITVRFQKGNTPRGGDYVVYENRELIIQSTSINEEGDKRYLTLRCETIEDSISEDSGSSSGGSDGYDLPGGRYRSEGGVVRQVPEDWVSYSVNFDMLPNDFIPTIPMGVYIDGNMYVDFGDGVKKEYPQGKLVIKQYAKETNQTITVWHDNTPDNVTVIDDYGGRAAMNNGYSGTLPSSMVAFNAADSLTEMPVLPPLAKRISIGGTSLSAESLNELMDSLIANGQTEGQLFMLTGPKSYADLTKIGVLQSRDWQVTAWGVPPNL